MCAELKKPDPPLEPPLPIYGWDRKSNMDKEKTLLDVRKGKAFNLQVQPESSELANDPSLAAAEDEETGMDENS